MRRTVFKDNLDVLEAKGPFAYWEISNKLNVHQNTLLNWMRKEMDQDKKNMVLKAIAELKQELAKDE